jgi:hypothetical protein
VTGESPVPMKRLRGVTHSDYRVMRLGVDRDAGKNPGSAGEIAQIQAEGRAVAYLGFDFQASVKQFGGL